MCRARSCGVAILQSTIGTLVGGDTVTGAAAGGAAVGDGAIDRGDEVRVTGGAGVVVVVVIVARACPELLLQPAAMRPITSTVATPVGIRAA